LSYIPARHRENFFGVHDFVLALPLLRDRLNDGIR
jgi:hypothetical protein